MPTRRLIIQLSDLHLVGGGELIPGVDPRAHLEAALEALSVLDRRPDVLLFTGDLADRGEAVAYETLRTLADVTAERLGAAVVFVPGNHDSRREMRRLLLDTEPTDDPIDGCYLFGGLRLATLDSTVPGVDWGELRPSQLDWLDKLLADPAPEGTLLVLHHPPIPSPIVQMTGLALREPERLAEVIRGRDLALIVCGHNHHASVGTFAGVPVAVGPSAAYRANALIEGRFVQSSDGGLARIDLDAGNALVTYLPI